MQVYLIAFKTIFICLFFFFFKQAKNVFKGDLCCKKEEWESLGTIRKESFLKMDLFQYPFQRKKI